MAFFLVVVTVFVVFHIVPALPAVRHRLAAAAGERAFLIGYGSLSTVLMIALFWTYFDAPYVELWAQSDWMKWVPLLGMPVAWVLAITGLLSPNPLSISFVAAAKFDVARPGIVAIVRHPALWALGIWSATHMVPNGDVASIVMFGLLTLLCLYGPLSLNKKKQQRLGAARWRDLASATSEVPFAAVLSDRTRVDWRGIGWAKVFLGLVLYVGFLFVHEMWIGVSPLPLHLM